jgi:ATP-dependent exoDNAse (exonuclease V) beta subunit
MAFVTHNACFTYRFLERVDSPNGRQYRVAADKSVPSVTTILSATKDMTQLNEWKKQVGEIEAERIKTDAAEVGTALHRVMEYLILGEDQLLQPSSWLEVRGYEMGFRLARAYLHNIDEYWGAEVPLCYPDRYAGTCDLVGVWQGKPAIIDFKQSLKPKRKEWITDYFHQLAAYACAHDKEHGTDINFGVILVATQTGDVQLFTTTGSEFENYKSQWLERVERYYGSITPAA